MSDRKLCSGCLRDEEENVADSWCNECLEEVCEVCAKVHRRFNPPHKVIPIHQVSNLISSILQISKDCDVHTDQRTVLYCTQHDKVICDLCLSDTHKNCESIISIDRAAKGVNSGTALADLKSRMKHLSKVFHDMLKCQTKDEKEFDKQRVDILQRISTFRQQINNHLDNIESEAKDGLNKQYKTTKQKMEETKCKTQRRHESLETLMKELSSIESITNEVQLFQTIKALDNKTHREETDICKPSTQYIIEFDPFDTKDLLDIFQSIGKITIIENQTHIPELQHYLQHVQVSKNPMEEGKKKTHRTHSFMTSVLGSKVYIYEGCFVSEKRILLSSSSVRCIYVCGYDGNEIHMIKLEHEPFSVAMIDNRSAIVTVGQEGFQILDLRTLTLGRCIKPERHECYAVTCNYGQIWTVDEHQTINQIDISGNILQSITTKNSVRDFCIDHNGNIYYIMNSTFSEDHSIVNRITPDGQESIFCNHSSICRPMGIDEDDKGNVYVSGMTFHKIFRISPDGKDFHIIMTENEGLRGPGGLCYNRGTQQLLVVNYDQTNIAVFSLH